jgi:urease beta subunit
VKGKKTHNNYVHGIGDKELQYGVHYHKFFPIKKVSIDSQPKKENENDAGYK